MGQLTLAFLLCLGGIMIGAAALPDDCTDCAVCDNKKKNLLGSQPPLCTSSVSISAMCNDKDGHGMTPCSTCTSAGEPCNCERECTITIDCSGMGVNQTCDWTIGGASGSIGPGPGTHQQMENLTAGCGGSDSVSGSVTSNSCTKILTLKIDPCECPQ